MLDQHCVCTGNLNFSGKTGFPFQPVGIVGDVVILPQDSRSACCFPNHRSGTVPALQSTFHQVIRPRLCCDRIPEADQGAIFCGSQHVDVTEEIHRVGLFRSVRIQHCVGSLVTHCKIAAGQRSGNHYTGTHFRKLRKVQAHCNGRSLFYRKRCRITLQPFACRNRHAGISGKGQRNQCFRQNAICTVRHGNGGTSQVHRFVSAEVVQCDPQCTAVQHHFCRIPQCQVFRIIFRTAFSN